MANTTGEQAVQRLREHFLQRPAEEQASGWESMWQEKVTPWDRSKPNPALVDTLQQKGAVLGQPLKSDGSRKRAFVPGCGGGYDVFLLASYGYDAVGLDVAPTAVNNARAQLAAEDSLRQEYPIQDASTGAGKATFCLADFFKNDFWAELGYKQFDLIYDYTFLCALPPVLRPKWAARMSELLAPGGVLICVEFPLGKPLSAGGPPHGLSSEVYPELFRSPGGEIEYDDAGIVVQKSDAPTAANALQRVDHWRPERSHHVGQGKDMLSLWQHV